MAAYVCPKTAAVQTTPAMLTMENCAGVDLESPALCSAQQSGGEFALEHLAMAPALAPITVSTIAPASLPRELSLPTNLESWPSFELGSDPPYQRTQRLRI